LGAQRRQLATLLAHEPACERQRLLAELVVHLAPPRLDWCAQFLQEEARAPQVCFLHPWNCQTLLWLHAMCFHVHILSPATCQGV
jgi:hypothetical protein